MVAVGGAAFWDIVNSIFFARALFNICGESARNRAVFSITTLLSFVRVMHKYVRILFLFTHPQGL